MKILLHLYPAAWRARYQDEFLAVLEERPLSPFDVLDVALGALDAHLRPGALAIDIVPRRHDPMNARVAGLAAMIGGAMVLTIAGLASFASQATSALFPLLFLVAAVALLIALVGLSAVQGRERPVLTWAGVLIPVTAIVVSLIGFAGTAIRGDGPLVAGLSGWWLWMFGILGVVIGSIPFAGATAVARVFSRAAALTLLLGSALVALTGVPVVMGLVDSPVLVVLAVVGIGLFSGGWIWLGYAASSQRAVTDPAATG